MRKTLHFLGVESVAGNKDEGKKNAIPRSGGRSRIKVLENRLDKSQKILRETVDDYLRLQSLFLTVVEDRNIDDVVLEETSAVRRDVKDLLEVAKRKQKDRKAKRSRSSNDDSSCKEHDIDLLSAQDSMHTLSRRAEILENEENRNRLSVLTTQLAIAEDRAKKAESNANVEGQGHLVERLEAQLAYECRNSSERDELLSTELREASLRCNALITEVECARRAEELSRNFETSLESEHAASTKALAIARSEYEETKLRASAAQRSRVSRLTEKLDHARSLLLKKTELADKLTDETLKLRARIESGAPEAKLILSCAASQARREVLVEALNRKVRTYREKNLKLSAEVERLRKENRRLSDAGKGKCPPSDVDVAYLKNVVVQYLTLTKGSAARARCLRLVQSILALTPSEVRRVREAEDQWSFF